MTGSSEQSPPPADRDVLLTLYSVLSTRRTAYDTLFWQAPVLSLTAQAFLFTVALSGGTPVWSRRIAAVLALLAALASIQLMVKHRYQETLDCMTCERVERRLEVDRVFGLLPHGAPAQRMPSVKPKGLQKWKSYHLWLGLLSLFAVVALLVIVLTFAKAFDH